MNKEQLKHLIAVIEQLAIAQFAYFGGKNLYLFSKDSEVDYVIVGLSALIWLIAHVMIHVLLEGLEDGK